MFLAEIALNVPLDDTYFYIIPEGMLIQRLLRVLVNFGGREMTGFVLAVFEESQITEKIKSLKLKEIKKVLDLTPIIDDKTLSTAEWMSRFYINPLGETLFACTPQARNEKRYKHSSHFNGMLADLNPEQQKAFEAIVPSIGKPETFLIHGITGSGKTEVYKHLVKKTLSMGKSAILLIPEIALTPQNLERFYQTFGDEVTVYHSKLTQNEKLGEWMRALRNESHLVIGPRSAVFSPVQNLGLIIIDEEHESSYKSGNSPRYHARQVAYRRAAMEGALLVLGSATPLVETYYYALKGDIKLIELKERYGGTSLPEVTILDMKSEEREKQKNLISTELLEKMLATIQRKKQTLLFLNRRGFSPVLICKDCGHIFQCPNCNVSLTYHLSTGKLNCHHCGHIAPVPEKCPQCGNTNLSELGSGTEKLESLIMSAFPNYRIGRMDLDTTRKKNSYIDILDQVKKGEIDILIGTQMVAKGHDIPGIHLVGVVLPDIILNIPDFRSAERTFVLLTQVIGRAGRREERGEAIIQTYMADHYSIIAASEQNYKKFYDTEIIKRKSFHYPPFNRIGRVVIRGTDQEKVIEFSLGLKEWMKNSALKKDGEILGPVSCPIEKLKNNYRYHIIIKSNNINKINHDIRAVRDYFKKSPLARFLYLEMDIDPVSLV